MRRWNLNSGRDKIMSEINVTPMVDVALVLLVIFMVTTPLILNESFKIKLPTAISSDAQPEVKLTISVTKENEIYLNDKAVTLETLAGVITPKIEASSDKTVVIRADKHVYHGTVVQVLDICKKAGAQRPYKTNQIWRPLAAILVLERKTHFGQTDVCNRPQKPRYRFHLLGDRPRGIEDQPGRPVPARQGGKCKPPDLLCAFPFRSWAS